MNRTLLAFMLVLCSVASAQQPSYLPTDGLVAWYPFDGNALDESGHLFHGTAQGAVLAEDRHGNASSAYHFDGQSHIDLGNFPELNPQYLSISVWFRQDSHNLVSGLSTILGRNLDDGPNRYGYNIGVFGGSSWELSPDEGLRYGFKSVVNSPPTDVDMGGSVPVSAWHHYVAVKDSVDQEIRFYLNGSIVGTQALEIGPTLALDAKTMIGIYRPNGAHAFTGYIDDVGIWNRALSPTEIQTLFTLTPLGCTNEQACNYDASAIEDDGSCVYPPSLDLGEDIETCEDSVTLDAGEGFGSYLWSTGDTTRNIQVQESGIYGVEVFEGYENLRSVHLNAPTILESSQEDLIHDIFSGTHPFSISLWVKSDDYTNGQICDKGYIYSASESNASSMQVFVGGNGLSFQVYSDGDNWLSVTTDSDHVPEEGQWSHIVCCYDGGVDFSSMSIFINGELIDTSGDQVQEGNFDGLHSNTEPLHFGARVSAGGSYAYPLSGLLDDIKVFDQALTATQVDDLYTCGSCLNPAYHWGFEDPQHVVGELISGHFQSTGQGTSTLYSPSFSGNDFVSSSNEVRLIHPNCVSSDSISVFLVPCGDLPSLCGEGTVWDPFNQECIVAIPTDTDFDGCVAAGDLLNLLGTFGSCPPIPFSGPCQGQDHVTYQGYDYDIVAIGEQCWFAENARYVSYVSPPHVGWEDDGGPHAYVVGYSGTSVDEAMAVSEYATYGALYNFAAVEDSEMCPSGWHVPTVLEWDKMENFIGILSADKLKAAPPVWDGTNELGFNAIRVPVRISSGSFGAFNVKADFWTSTSFGDNDAWGREFNSGQNFITHDGNGKNAGQPVRCIKDQ